MASSYVPTVNDLRQLTNPIVGSVQVGGYYAEGDGGAGVYRWDAGSALPPNDGSVVAPDGVYSEASGYAAGRYLLLHDGVVNVRQFGAKGDGVVRTFAANEFARFKDTDVYRQAKRLYPGMIGQPFSGLKSDDTWDWAAIQTALIWCGLNGGRLEGNEGVYQIRRPLWMGDDSPASANNETDEIVTVQGLTFVGQTGNSRQETDGQCCNIRLTGDCTSRYVLSGNLSQLPASPNYELKLDVKTATGFETRTTAPLNITDTANAVLDAMNAVLAGTGHTAVADVPDTTLTLLQQNLYFRIADSATLGEFLGPINAVLPSTETQAGFVRCLADSGIVSFRRSAGFHYRLEGLSLKGNQSNASTARNASFGVLFATSQFVGHVVELVNVAFADTALGILRGTGVNGEQCRVSRVFGQNLRRGYYSDAPQAFQQEFDGWNLGLDNDGCFAEFAQVDSPGVGASFYSAAATFGPGGNLEGAGTLVKVRRGTGALNFFGGRFEHLARLFDYDAVSAQGANNNLDVVVRGAEFDGVRGGADRSFLLGEVLDAQALGTNYGLGVQDCKFRPQTGLSADKADLRLVSDPRDGLRAVFERCRFVGVRSVQSLGGRADFARCYKNDFAESGGTAQGLPLRQFTEQTGAPGPRTQSLRTAWQDTPWIQTGRRANVLKNSDLVLQTPGLAKLCNAPSWSLKNLAGTADKAFAAFGKWGQPGIGGIGDVSPGPESFGFKLSADSSLRNKVDFVDLGAAGSKVVTFQCLCQVAGTARFRLVNSTTPADVYDEVAVSGPGTAASSPTLVTLRAQVAGATTGHPEVRFENDSGADCTVQVVWQQAWAGGGNSVYSVEDGLRNFAQVRTPTAESTENTYAWGVNATSVLAAQRFRLPLKDEAFGWKAAVLAGMDIDDGEVYYDADQKATVARARGGWFVLQQAESVARLGQDTLDWERGAQKNIISERTGSGQVTVTLGSSNIVAGTMVRVFRIKVTPSATKPVRVTASGANYDLEENRMAEFLFDSGAGKWLCLQFNVAVK